ncbi:outer membrane protein assembly factor BamC [Salinicola sp. DM10]|uniref:outer membrane protein assembly factor BamC n=1 Tax=Salinicola sp. DM10 TaxID=2815721 RepID=UPI001A8F9C37|nr:outer membrane protein assembly factor BamC [Salinicola sp. DM10]MCE3027043.1 outer membrane protein assembly factor BamC [Salinicola sp. DM10]
MKPILKGMPLVLCATLTLSGCGLFQDGYYYNRDDEYRDAKMSEPLQLPSSSNPIRYQDSMPVPQADSDFMASSDTDAPRPQPLAAGPSEGQPFVEARQAGNERWLLVNAAPASVWPRLQGFAVDHGVRATDIDPAKGRIQTAQGAISLRQGLRSGTSEVRCDIGDAGQCLSGIKAYLEASGASDSGVSLAAQPLDQSERVKLINRDGTWQLNLALDANRAWSELYYQLQNGFDQQRLKLVDQNRSAGEFFVDYRPEDQGGGWFDWFGGGSDEARPYRLQLASQAALTSVTVTDPKGKPVPPIEARDLLDAIAATLR